MDTILALREKRKNLWDAAKNFLDTVRDENGMVSAEDAARYDKMEADVVNLGKEIDRLERQQQLDAQLAQPTTMPITELPGAGQNGAEKRGRASDAYRKAFWDSIRHKNFIDVQNALSAGTDADGGYLVPDEFEHQLIVAVSFLRVAFSANSKTRICLVRFRIHEIQKDSIFVVAWC